MSTARPSLRLFLDHNVPESAAVVLEAAGHVVRRLRTTLPIDAQDELVAAMAAESGELLVSHDRDFKAMARRFGLSRARIRQFSLLKLSCTEPRAAARLLQCMSLLEHEWRYCQEQGNGVLQMEVSKATIRIER